MIIDEQKKLLIDNAISNFKQNHRGLSNALKLMISDIRIMRKENLNTNQQILVLNKILGVEIKYDTYSKWISKNFKKQDEKPKNENFEYEQIEEIVALENEPKIEKKSNETIEEMFNKTVSIKSDLADLI